MKRYVYYNTVLKDERLPFKIEISRSLTVYYSYPNSNQLMKADVLHHKIGWLSISIGDYLIIVKGIDKNNELVYIIIEKRLGGENNEL